MKRAYALLQITSDELTKQNRAYREELDKLRNEPQSAVFVKKIKLLEAEIARLRCELDEWEGFGSDEDMAV